MKGGIPTTSKITIGVPIGCRTDEAVTRPIVRELEKRDRFNVDVIDLVPGDSDLTARCVLQHINTGNARAVLPPGIDFMLCVADRTEMLVAAAVAHASGIPIGHVYAGTGSNVATLDDLSRHAITMLSEIQFCESKQASGRVEAMMMMAGLKANVHVVGITHLDDLEIDHDGVPKEKYTLVLYNPLTSGPDLAKRVTSEIDEILRLLGDDKEVYLIGSNPDHFPEGTTTACERLLERSDTYDPSLPRPKFLGLLEGCDRFLTNSSAGIYEAPVLMTGRRDRIVMIGERNRDRDRGPFETGASKKIADILEAHLAPQ